MPILRFATPAAILCGLACALALPAVTPDYGAHFSLNATTDPRFAAYENSAAARLDNDLAALINQATTTLDCADYNLTAPVVADALVAAKGRGVQVRFITEHDNLVQAATATQMQKLTNAGIPWIDDTFGGQSGGNLMHDKFLVADAGVTASPVRDLVVTGSYNWTQQATLYNAENIVTVRDAALAQAYLAQFNILWGGSGATPDSVNSRFSTAKPADTAHPVHPGCPSVNATAVFGPKGNLRQALIDAVNSADFEIDFSIDVFTDDAVQQAMLARRAAVPGLIVRGVFETSTALSTGSEFPAMNGDAVAGAWNPRADILKDAVAGGGQLHHKYLIVDAAHEDSDPILVTGSPNWSGGGFSGNDENLIVFHDARLANDFLQEFAARYYEAGGTAMTAPAAGAFAAARPPYFPCGLISAAATGSHGSVLLNWDAALDLNPPLSYQIYDSGMSGGENYSLPRLTTGATSVLVTGLSDGAARWFVVRASDGGSRQESNVLEKSATPVDLYPPLPPALTIAKAAAGALQFTWTIPATDTAGGAEAIQNFELYQAATPAFPLTATATYGAAATSALRTPPASTQFFTLRAVDLAGNRSD